MVVLLNIDRYVYVKLGVRAKSWCNPRCVHLTFIGIVVFAVLFNLPRFWEFIPLIEHSDESLHKCYGYYMLSKTILINIQQL